MSEWYLEKILAKFSRGLHSGQRDPLSLMFNYFSAES